MDTHVQFLEYIVKAIVSRPEAVRVSKAVDEMGTLLTVNVAREDMGSIIGKNGKTATAIRDIVHVVGMKNKARVSVKINEPS